MKETERKRERERERERESERERKRKRERARAKRRDRALLFKGTLAKETLTIQFRSTVGFKGWGLGGWLICKDRLKVSSEMIFRLLGPLIIRSDIIKNRRTMNISTQNTAQKKYTSCASHIFFLAQYFACVT